MHCSCLPVQYVYLTVVDCCNPGLLIAPSALELHGVLPSAALSPQVHPGSTRYQGPGTDETRVVLTHPQLLQLQSLAGGGVWVGEIGGGGGGLCLDVWWAALSLFMWETSSALSPHLESLLVCPASICNQFTLDGLCGDNACPNEG